MRKDLAGSSFSIFFDVVINIMEERKAKGLQFFLGSDELNNVCIYTFYMNWDGSKTHSVTSRNVRLRKLLLLKWILGFMEVDLGRKAPG